MRIGFVLELRRSYFGVGQSLEIALAISKMKRIGLRPVAMEFGMGPDSWEIELLRRADGLKGGALQAEGMNLKRVWLQEIHTNMQGKTQEYAGKQEKQKE